MIPSPTQGYQTMQYRRCGKSGIVLPELSFGLWHNFGEPDNKTEARELILTAFDAGITHFDLANNYGPPAGAAEILFGQFLKNELASHRDELIISTKAGYGCWEGPYGDGGSRKYLMSSLNRSLKQMGLDYVDIYYHHRPDSNTPLEESMRALADIVKQGKSLYIGLSNYPADLAAKAFAMLAQMNTPCLVHQPSYNMLDRWIEPELLPLLEKQGVGCVVFVPLAQGLLTGKYLKGIPSDSRATKAHGFLKPKDLTDEKLLLIQKLNQIAVQRGQSLSQLALQWVLRLSSVTSAIIGASKVGQLKENIAALKFSPLTDLEIIEIEKILNNKKSR